MLRVRATAPLRVCDLGGWTDTWFAGTGLVVNLAVEPRVEVEVVARSRRAQPAHVIHAHSYSESYAVDPLAPGPHPLLEQAIGSAGLPDEVTVEVSVRSAVPPGASMGTSAAVVVAILAALDAVVGRSRSPYDLARAAHLVETERMGWQSGIQDQHASANGGATLIEMSAYPEARVSSLDVPAGAWDDLGARLVVVLLSRPHVSSSAIHDQVIGEFEQGTGSAELERLRSCARVGADALVAGDLATLGAAMKANTDAQAVLHPGLVNAEARAVIAAAAGAGATGWKVNGAGGDGGSLTLLAGPAGRDALVRTLGLLTPQVTVVPAALSRTGVTVH